MALLAFIAFMDFIAFMAFMAGIVFIFFMVELAFMALALATCRRQCKTHATKLLGNHTGGLAGFALGHLQVHARTGEDKHAWVG